LLILFMMAAVVVMEDVMGKQLVPDDLWELVEPILPKHTRSPKGGKPRTKDRVCLSGIIFVLKTGLPWEDFPQEMGCCGMTLWNRLHEWMKAGVWEKLHRLLLDKLRDADEIDFDRVVADSASVRAVHGGKKRDRIPWTAEKTAPNITWSSMPAESRWRQYSPPPTVTM
jgi:transposase